MVGEYDKGIDQLEYLLSVPGQISIPLLRLDPDWDPLRDHPRFKRLLETRKSSKMVGEPQEASGEQN